eukprot:10799150-Alexandrium_andersonii.AAC.1
MAERADQSMNKGLLLLQGCTWMPNLHSTPAIAHCSVNRPQGACATPGGNCPRWRRPDQCHSGRAARTYGQPRD